jgi:hypothetical protein
MMRKKERVILKPPRAVRATLSALRHFDAAFRLVSHVSKFNVA